MSDGERIIAAIISGALCHAECIADRAHPCVVVWSSGAAEQLEAVLADIKSDGTEKTQ